MSKDDTLSGLISQALRTMLAELQTSMPAEIVSYNHKKQEASVKPCIRRRYADGVQKEFPIISGVPVVFPRCGGASLTMPVKAGDPVQLFFTARSIGTWLANGGTVDGDDNRMHDLNDAVAHVGLYPFSGTSPQDNNDDVLLQYDGNSLRLKKGGTTEVKAKTIIAEAEKITATATEAITMKSPLVTIDAAETRMTGSLTVVGDIYDQDAQQGSFANIREIFNSHDHDENDIVGGGVTDEPNQQMGVSE